MLQGAALDEINQFFWPQKRRGNEQAPDRLAA
jgi:hypothetical protein